MLPTGLPSLFYYYIKKFASDHLVGLCLIERVSKTNDSRRFLSGGQLAMTQLLLATGTKYKKKIKHKRKKIAKYANTKKTQQISKYANTQLHNWP